MKIPKLRFVKKLIGWFFTYPAYRKLSPVQSEGILALMTLALYADGEPEESEREELERELTGVPHFWADEDALRDIVRTFSERVAHEDFEALVAEVKPRIEGLDPAFLLTGAAFICHGDHRLTDLERQRLTSMGRTLGVAEVDIDRIIRDPKAAGSAMLTQPPA